MSVMFCSSCYRGAVRWASSNVLVANQVNVSDLHKLFTGKIAALQVPNFCPPVAVNAAMEKFRIRSIEEYTNAKGVGKFGGTAYFETQASEQVKNLYYDTRIANLQELRAIFDPFLSPIDKIRVILDEQWPQGAALLNLGRGPMFVGLTRGMTGEILPHEDKLERDDPSTLAKVNCIAQIAFNCYLSMPQEGGNLQLWNKTLDTTTYDEMRGASYGIPRTLLPPPFVSIRPNVGDFIAFNARCLHAVVAGSDNSEVRTSASGFIAYQGDDRPLHFWS